MTGAATITEHGETFEVHPQFVHSRELVRALCEHRLTRDPDAKIITAFVIPKRRPPAVQTQVPRHPNYDGKTFWSVFTGEEVKVIKRNIYGKLIVRYRNGEQAQIPDREFEVAFTLKR